MDIPDDGLIEVPLNFLKLNFQFKNLKAAMKGFYFITRTFMSFKVMVYCIKLKTEIQRTELFLPTIGF